MCGEQKGSPSWPYTYMGSPPRVRGTVGGIGKIPLQEGITPACAGNSPLYEKDLPRSRDHPRVCGEQAAYLLEELGRKGSPPRVRGTAGMCDCVAQAWGITPACAGNSCCGGIRPPAPKDHPRVCGEQRIAGKCKVREVGSPPRVRGTAAATAGWVERGGITPACAGNRARPCGTSRTGGGSPPRVRGTGRTTAAKY